MAVVLWQDPEQAGAERCGLVETPGGATLAGTALLAVGGAPVEVRYEVRVDGRWRTRHVEVHVVDAGADADGGAAAIVVEADGEGAWHVDGVRQEHLDGCLDVDLEFSPATNMLPIRRLGLAVGDEAPVDAAWLRFPGLTLEASRQRYRRTGEDGYRFSIPGFVADLTLDDSGLVRTYGAAWRQVARSASAAGRPPR